ncbi:unnamed protein product [Lupinus luteus]|uniref:Alpha/beta hydrolase fold-3 domain-containing protein n=1 Tax=Lupinus luteus TaxID=3873 RepID=A0AAV1XSH4_LUPLU
MADEPPPFQSSKLSDLLKIHLNQNGTLTRFYDVVPTLPPSPTPPTNPNSNPIHALSKDIPLNPTTTTSLRLFLPHPPPPPSVKLPVVLYFHGGGFILFHASSSVFHDSCSDFASLFPAIVASVDYRLAPEHRLPAAYDDAVDAINWLRNQTIDPTKSEPWIRDHADFNNCFLMGCSAGANIAYFAGLRALDMDINPIKIKGLIMHVPYFSGVQRSESELRLINDQLLPLHKNDMMWNLSLPKGSNRDHMFCNPMVSNVIYGDKIGKLPRCFINGNDGDPLVDKQKELAKILEGHGVQVVQHFVEDGFHAIELFDKAKAMVFCENVKKFVVEAIAS